MKGHDISFILRIKPEYVKSRDCPFNSSWTPYYTHQRGEVSRGLFMKVFHWISFQRNLPDMENWVSKIVDEKDVRKALTTFSFPLISLLLAIGYS